MQFDQLGQQQVARNVARMVKLSSSEPLDPRVLNIVRVPEPAQILAKWLTAHAWDLKGKLIALVAEDARMAELVPLLPQLESLGLSVLPLDGASDCDDQTLLDRVTAMLQAPVTNFSPDAEQGQDGDIVEDTGLPGDADNTRLDPYVRPAYRLSDDAYDAWLNRLKQDPGSRDD